MTDKLTAADFIKNFDHFRRSPDNGNVIIHPGLPYNLIELTGDFVDEMKHDLTTKIFMAHNNIRELSPIDKFAIMMLEKAF